MIELEVLDEALDGAVDLVLAGLTILPSAKVSMGPPGMLSMSWLMMLIACLASSRRTWKRS
jgi:hypothetical protein